ncbi:MAG: hypothetical protein HYR89_07480 [Actinobacteria bacterium]|nr:hypothetical protein [Actinomycetota bacterium]MBI3257490.1 hypothetical protein [Actinomycetota bacterium]
MKGKWAQGITPRHFTWVIKDQLAVCERPGGYGPNHRRVRRQEEIIWLREQGFTRIISLLTSPHNLHVYEEMDMAWMHVPFGRHDDPVKLLSTLLPDLRRLLGKGERILMHQDAVEDTVQGTIGGYLVYAGLAPDVPRGVEMAERLLSRPLSSSGRELVGLAGQLTPER